MAVRKLLFAEEVSLAAAVAVILVIPASVLLMFLLLLPLLRFFPVRVHELGIQGYDVYGRRAEVAWPHIHGAGPISVVGLTYLRISTTGSGRALWVPRFLCDQSAFDRLVAEWAGAAHPLTRSLQTPAA